jgi:co-chaperonin GroES (HSP10)
MNRIIIPTGKRVLVQIEPAPQMSHGIHTPFATQNDYAVVKAIGPRMETELKVGQRVLIQAYGGLELHVGDHRLRLLESKDILALA